MSDKFSFRIDPEQEQVATEQLARRVTCLAACSDYMREIATDIVRAGGLSADSEGRSIYKGRADHYLTATLFDPHLRRDVLTRIRMRITVEPLPFSPPQEPQQG